MKQQRGVAAIRIHPGFVNKCNIDVDGSGPCLKAAKTIAYQSSCTFRRDSNGINDTTLSAASSLFAVGLG